MTLNSLANRLLSSYPAVPRPGLLLWSVSSTSGVSRLDVARGRGKGSVQQVQARQFYSQVTVRCHGSSPRQAAASGTRRTLLRDQLTYRV
jgi:hypothetical protein